MVLPGGSSNSRSRPTSMELRELPRRRGTQTSASGTRHMSQRGPIDLPPIDTRLRTQNIGGSQSMPPSPTSAGAPRFPQTPLTATATEIAKGGKMTKVPHYGRLRSVTARVLRMVDPRAYQRQHQHEDAMEQAPRGFVEAVKDRAAARRARRYSHGSIPTGLSRHGSREYGAGVGVALGGLKRLSMEISHLGKIPSHSSSAAAESAGRGSLDMRRFSQLGDALSPVHSMGGEVAGGGVENADDMDGDDEAMLLQQQQAAIDSVITIPTPGFFLDPVSDDWMGGHSFRQRMRYPDEVITVPASLTKRVHYEVSYDYPKNAISTARYNVVTFLPAQLAAQFSKIANVYFLFIAALQQVPGWSTTGRWSTLLPLCVFVSLSIAHEGFDDLRRHRMDHAENTQRTRVLKVKVHDKEQRLSFRFRDLRHRGSHSIHSFRMRSSQSIHELGRSTLESAKRVAGSTLRIGSTVKEAVVSRLAEKRRKQRELEDSDDEEEMRNEETLRNRLNKGVISLRSWRSNQTTGNGNSGNAGGRRADDDDEDEDLDAIIDGSMIHTPFSHRRGLSRISMTPNTDLSMPALSVQPPPPRRTGPTVAFNDVVEEQSAMGDDDLPENPLPDNMSCRWKRKKWEDVQVGDMLMIVKDEWIPADCVVIASTGFDGTCFVETAALDGETTLKQKQALEATNSAIQTAEQLAAFNAFTYVEKPSAELYSFEGFMEVDGERHALTPNQLLLRGSVLRNTAYVYAQVVYSGEQTRLRLNATRNIRTKAPQVQRITNRIVVLVFLMLLIMCFVFSALGINWNNTKRRGHWYLKHMRMPATALVFGYIVMMNALIPISLYVTLEAVKIFQCWFIQQDVDMYHDETDTHAEARTTAINEDLGMVRYVFSDKTGTLTENIMKLRAVMVAGFSYLHIDLDRLQPSQKKKASKSPQAKNSSEGSPDNGERSMSPVMRTRRLHQQNSHRRQQSLPGHAMVSRTLQQLAVTNRLNGGQQGSRVSQHSRGLSASVLRSPTAVSPAVSDDPLPRPNTPLSFNFPGTTPGTIPETETLLDHQTDTSDEAELESQVGGGAMTAESDPDLIAMDDDPRQHTRAKDDAPVSDLQLLPSSRSIMESAPPTQVFRSRAEWFLRCMALCHTVQPDRDPLTGRITGYQATSPDEKALVAAAAELGYVMNNRAGPLVQLRVVASERMRDFNEMAGAGELDGSFDRGVPAPDPTDRLGNYEVLDVLEFSSARKRMSVIYRCPDGRIIMVSKGADSALWPRLVQPNELRSDPSTTQSFMPKPAGHPLKRTLSRPSAAYLHSRTSSQASNADIDKFLKSALISTPVQARRTASRLGEESDITPSSPLLPGNFGDHLSAYESDYPTHQNVFGILRDSRDSIASSVNVMDQGQQEIPSSFETPTMEEEEWARARSLEALHQFSTEGLRTLVYAHKEIPPLVYEAWHNKYLAATTALANRQAQVELACEEIEHDLLLTGVSAIEDRLQDGVPETIFKLRRAGVRVWMLTGDKVETAINIAKSCRLIDTDTVEVSRLDPETVEKNPDKMLLLVMQGISGDDVHERLEKLLCQALDVARRLPESMDERFERRTRMQKMMRGLKSFGSKLDVFRAMRDRDALGKKRRWWRRREKQPADTVMVPGKQLDEYYDGESDDDDEIHATGVPLGGAQQATLQAPVWDTTATTTPTTMTTTADCGSVGKQVDYLESPVAVAREGTPTTIDSGGESRLDQTGDALARTSGATAVRQMKQPLLSSESDTAAGTSVESKLSASASLAVVVDGETLAELEKYPELLHMFLSLGTLCDAVVCSRVSPAQKALVVHNMRVRCEGGSGSQGGEDQQSKKRAKSRNPLSNLLRHNNDDFMVTLAIGDGGNDIAMIQEAHVGIGIAGQEGLQASRAADFSIAQFRFLQKLLLVHGRWSYVRVSTFVMGTFYKCMAFYVTQLIYQFYTGFSGTSLFESWTLSMYNTLFSILPVLVVGIFEQDLQPETLLAYPELYKDMGPANHLFTVPLFLRKVVLIGFLHSIVASLFPFAARLNLGNDMTTNDQYTNSLVVYGIMVLIATIKIAYIDVRRWVVFTHLGVILTLVLWFGWNGVLCHVYPSGPSEGYYVLGVFTRLMGKAMFWFQWIIFTAIAVCLNVLINIVYSVRDPVENRILAWVAFEQKAEREKRRKEKMGGAWAGRGLFWSEAGAKGNNGAGGLHRRQHSHIN